MIRTAELFDFSHSLAGRYLDDFAFPWEALEGLAGEILRLGSSLGTEYRREASGIWIHHTARIAPGAWLDGPCIIGPDTQLRHGAYVRGNVLIGAKCVVGNSTELKNSILFDCVQAPHFNYVGDSILGFRVHLGAGVILSNLKSDRSAVAITTGENTHPTGLRKLGSMVGDDVEIGCNSVLNPGTVIGRASVLYPGVVLRGLIPPRSIVKGTGQIVNREGF